MEAMQSKNKIINNCIYIAGIIGSIIGFYSSFPSGLMLLCLICYVLLMYKLIKVNTTFGGISFFWALGTMTILLIIEACLDKRRRTNDFMIYGGWRTIAIIDNKSSYKGDSKRLDFHYISRTKSTITGVCHCNTREMYDAINIGDTILIAHSNRIVSEYRIEKYFPSHEEIQKYKDGVPFEPKKQKE